MAAAKTSIVPKKSVAPKKSIGPKPPLAPKKSIGAKPPLAPKKSIGPKAPAAPKKSMTPQVPEAREDSPAPMMPAGPGVCICGAKGRTLLAKVISQMSPDGRIAILPKAFEVQFCPSCTGRIRSGRELPL
jgi:hypothetical protein